MIKEKKKKNKDEIDETSTVCTNSNEEEGVTFYVSIDKLQDHGVNSGDIAKLKQAGICTIKGMLMVTKKELLMIKGISEMKLEKMIEAAQKLENLEFISANQVMKKRTKIRKITTGSTAFDNLLCGGVESQAITEIFGEFRTGKTQLCLTLCVTAQLSQDIGGGGGKVIYIDTENTL